MGTAGRQHRVSDQLLRDWAGELLDPEVWQSCRLCFNILVYGILGLSCFEQLSRCRLKLQLSISTLLDEVLLDHIL